MFDLEVTAEQIAYATDVVNGHNFGQRGRGDGNRQEQLTGIIGQTVFSDLINVKRPTGEEGFDGGVDFNINDRTVDIKTMTRKGPVKSYYVHNFVGYQQGYDVDYYIFASYNTTKKVLTICGYMPKDEFFARADYFEKGSVRRRSDGTTFRTFAPLYEIRQTSLYTANSIEELIENIQ